MRGHVLTCEAALASWTIDRISRLSCASGAIAGVGATARGLAFDRTTVLLVVDPGLVGLDVHQPAVVSLRAAGLEPILFDAFKPDPTCAQADAGVALAREHGVGVVVAMGGGSALDIGKAIAAIAPGAEPAATYALGARDLPPRPLPKICVPTTAGTGSEVTCTSVLTRDDGAKVWLWGDAIKADLVLLDPSLSVSLPPALTTATGIDALVHAIEACTNRNASAAGDVFAHAAIGMVARWLPGAVERPDDLEARGQMLLAAALAGIAIDNAGTAIAHNIGHALGSLRPVHHGRAVGTAMLATLAWNAEHEDGRWSRVAETLGSITAAAGFAALVRRVGLRVALDEAQDVTPEQLAAQMAQPENEPMRRANARPVGDDDLLTLARMTLEAA